MDIEVKNSACVVELQKARSNLPNKYNNDVLRTWGTTAISKDISS